jgi:hypothetical protein
MPDSGLLARDWLLHVAAQVLEDLALPLLDFKQDRLRHPSVILSRMNLPRQQDSSQIDPPIVAQAAFDRQSGSRYLQSHNTVLTKAPGSLIRCPAKDRAFRRQWRTEPRRRRTRTSVWPARNRRRPVPGPQVFRLQSLRSIYGGKRDEGSQPTRQPYASRRRTAEPSLEFSSIRHMHAGRQVLLPGPLRKHQPTIVNGYGGAGPNTKLRSAIVVSRDYSLLDQSSAPHVTISFTISPLTSVSRSFRPRCK